MLVGYARISTEDQKLDLPHDALRVWARVEAFDRFRRVRRQRSIRVRSSFTFLGSAVRRFRLMCRPPHSELMSVAQPHVEFMHAYRRDTV